MNIESFEKDTSLRKFLDFIKQVNNEWGSNALEVVYHDWDKMCGIEIRSLKESICFNFYDDGTFRCLIREIK